MKRGAALLALLLVSCNARGAPPEIAIEDAWARSAVAGQAATAAYFTIRNAGGEDRLTGIFTPVGTASLHSTTTADGIVRMRPVEALEIPADSAVALEPGGTHVMITGLTEPLDEGERIPLDLAFERSGKMRVTTSVRSAATNGVTM